jgi:hypothetical protein
MKIKDYRCECGCKDFFFKAKGSQIGIYCSNCGMLFKWADKNERNLAMKLNLSTQYGFSVSRETEKSNDSFDLESWVIGLLDCIQMLSEKGENFDLHLESEAVNEIAEAYKRTEWIEIY